MKHSISHLAALTVLFLMCFLFYTGYSYAGTDTDHENRVCFRWAFGAMVGREGDRRLVAITRDTVLKTGDRLKLLVQLKSRCYIYLFYRTAEDDIFLLFPYSLDHFEADCKIGKKYYIPRGSAWFELDQNVGVERFYLLASVERLMALESLYNKYISVAGSDKAEVADKLLAHIRKIRRKHHTFASVAERPIAIGGNVRGTRKNDGPALPDIDPIASEVTAYDFYGKTFTIGHK